MVTHDRPGVVPMEHMQWMVWGSIYLEVFNTVWIRQSQRQIYVLRCSKRHQSLHCGGVSSYCKSNSCLYLRKSLRRIKVSFFPERWKEFHSLPRRGSLRSLNVILDGVGCHELAIKIDPIMPSTWLSLCVRFQILLSTRCWERKVAWLTNQKEGRWTSRCWKHVI